MIFRTFLLASLLTVSASATVLMVPGTASIFGAGHTVSDGTLPPFVTLPAGTGRSLTINSVTGNITNTNGAEVIVPDGNATASNILSSAGISGYISPRSLSLVGVFLSGVEPSDPAPATLDFNTIGLSFTVLAPVLEQTFFIGDGRTGNGTGAVQVFQIPDGATRFYLGVADAQNFVGPPSFYEDNGGSVTATFTVVPEPTSALLVLCGAALWVRRVRRG